MSDLSENVRDYLSLGWALCPIPTMSKGPRKTGWNRRENAVVAQNNIGLITANVGLLHAYSGTVSIDIDDVRLAKPYLYQNGVDLEALMLDTQSVMIDSGRNNRCKLLYQYHEPLQYINMASRGLELRCADANGGSVQDVLPPSVHPNGTKYQWKGNGHYSRLPTLPPELLAFWKNGINQKPDVESQSISSGSRNDSLTSLAGKLRYQGKDADSITESLMLTNKTQCKPPLSDSEVRSIARSVCRYAPGADDDIEDEGTIQEGDPLLPSGDYLVAYVSHKINRDMHGHGPKIVVWFAVTEGDYQGSIIRAFYNIKVEGNKWFALPGSRLSIEIPRLFPDARKDRISPACLRGHIVTARVAPNKRGSHSVIRELLELNK